MKLHDSLNKPPKTNLRTIVIYSVYTVILMAFYSGHRAGTTLDSDSIHLIESFQEGSYNSYHKSRTSGYPMYEYIGGLIYRNFGENAVKFLSLAFTIVGLVILERILSTLNSGRSLALWACFALSPLILTNASAIMETSMFFFEVTLLFFLIRKLSLSKTSTLVGIFFLCFSLVSTRPDAIAITFAIFITGFFLNLNSKYKLAFLISVTSSTFLALLLIRLLTDVSSFTAIFDHTPNEIFSRKLLRFTGHLISLFGIPSVLIISFILVMLSVKVSRGGTASRRVLKVALEGKSQEIVLAIFLLFFQLLRFLLLPDEAEYLIAGLISVLVIASKTSEIPRFPSYISQILVVGMFSTSVFTVSIAERKDPWDINPQIGLSGISINKGGFFQDLEARHALFIRNTPVYKRWLFEQIRPIGQSRDLGYLVFPKDAWYTLVFKSKYTTYDENIPPGSPIYGCDEFTSTVVSNWRVLQPEAEYKDIDRFLKTEKMNCRVIVLYFENYLLYQTVSSANEKSDSRIIGRL